MLRKSLAFFVCALFFVQSFLIDFPYAYANSPLLLLPAAGQMIHLSAHTQPVMLQGLRYDPQKPFQFQFILEQGDHALPLDQLKDKGMDLVRYFMAAMTMPEDDLWVNLSPYESSRIIPNGLSVTRLGSDMLVQDYVLKQLSSSLTFPDSKLGKEFWQKIYAETQSRFGSTDMSVSTYNKVWIVPQYAKVLVKDNTVILIDSHLKVLMEQDYIAQKKASCGDACLPIAEDSKESKGQNLASDVMRQVIIPILENEVNTGAHFAPLRQIFHAVVLAEWYKTNLKESLFNQSYANQHKVAGIDEVNSKLKEAVYRRYLSVYKKGVYNFIREDSIPGTNQIIPRKYFSGGENMDTRGKIQQEDLAELSLSDKAVLAHRHAFLLSIQLDKAQLTPEEFIQNKTSNHFWSDVSQSLLRIKDKFLDLDPTFLHFYLNKNIKVYKKFTMLKIKDILPQNHDGLEDDVRIFWGRARNEGIEKLRTQGGERFLTLNDLNKDAKFRTMLKQFEDTKPTESQMEDFLSKYCEQEAKALAAKMGFKTAKMKYGGAKGVILMVNFVKDENGAVTLKDYIDSKNTKDNSRYGLQVKLAAFRSKSRDLTLDRVLLYNNDGWGADMNSGYPEMEAACDEHIRVLTEMGRENFVFKDKDGRVWYHEYDVLYDRLRDKLREIQEHPENYEVIQTPFLEIMAQFKEERHIPMPWLGTTTVKRVSKPSPTGSEKTIYLGGLEGRFESTGKKAVYVMMKILGDKFKGQTFAIHANGNVGGNAGIEIAHQEGIVRVISDYGIALTKGTDGTNFDDGWTESELRSIYDLQKPNDQFLKGRTLRDLWKAGLISPNGVVATIADSTDKDIFAIQEQKVLEAVLGAKVQNIVETFRERQIDEVTVNLINKNYVKFVWELANGGVTPAATLELFSHNINVRPDIETNAGGVVYSEIEGLEQATSTGRIPDVISSQKANELLDSMIDATKQIEKMYPGYTPTDWNNIMTINELIKTRMSNAIIKYSGDLNMIRLQYVEENDGGDADVGTVDDIMRRIKKLGLESLWKRSLQDGLRKYNFKMLELLPKVFKRYDLKLPIELNGSDFRIIVDAFNRRFERFEDTRENALRLMRTFLRVLDKDCDKNISSGKGETITETARRLNLFKNGQLDLTVPINLRQKLLGFVKNQRMAQTDTTSRSYQVWRALELMLTQRMAELNDAAGQVNLSTTPAAGFKQNQPVQLPGQFTPSNPAMSPDGGIDLGSKYELINQEGSTSFQFEDNGSSLEELQSSKGYIPIFLRMTPVNVSTLVGATV